MIVVVSPHLDDGVFGCGARLSAEPGSVVVTVLAAGPPSLEALTPWDEACGFSAGADVMAARKVEDLEALSHLGATPVWLDFLDAQYGPPPAVLAVAVALESTLSALRAEGLFLPLGLYHSDHLLVSEAGLALARLHPERVFHLYEDAIYRRTPGLTAAALERVRDRGLRATPVSFPAEEACLERKRRAVSRYRSQLRGLGAGGRAGHADVFEPERFWRLST